MFLPCRSPPPERNRSPLTNATLFGSVGVVVRLQTIHTGTVNISNEADGDEAQETDDATQIREHVKTLRKRVAGFN